MDSTTVYMMAKASKLAQMHSDSVDAATRATAEWIILRHDLVLLGLVSIPSVACIIAVTIWTKRNV